MHIDVQLLTTSLILCGSPVRAHARARTRTQTHIHTQPSWVHVTCIDLRAVRLHLLDDNPWKQPTSANTHMCTHTNALTPHMRAYAHACAHALRDTHTYAHTQLLKCAQQASMARTYAVCLHLLDGQLLVPGRLRGRQLRAQLGHLQAVCCQSHLLLLLLLLLMRQLTGGWGGLGGLLHRQRTHTHARTQAGCVFVVQEHVCGPNAPAHTFERLADRRGGAACRRRTKCGIRGGTPRGRLHPGACVGGRRALGCFASPTCGGRCGARQQGQDAQ